MAIHDQIARLMTQYPRAAIFTVILSVLGSICLALTAIFKPVGKRDRNARLPPGPRGVWLLGSILDFSRQRNEEVTSFVCIESKVCSRACTNSG
jgi:hypothetical protein